MKKNNLLLIMFLISSSVSAEDELDQTAIVSYEEQTLESELKTENSETSLEEILEEELKELEIETKPDYNDEELERDLENQLNSLLKDNSSTNKYNKLVLRVLDKIAARNKIYEINAGEEIVNGSLRVKFKLCINPDPANKENSFALIKVTDETNKHKPEKIFYGWMFAASPGLVSLEHPVYDISVVGCK